VKQEKATVMDDMIIDRAINTPKIPGRAWVYDEQLSREEKKPTDKQSKR
jgi:hypothetical protein